MKHTFRGSAHILMCCFLLCCACSLAAQEKKVSKEPPLFTEANREEWIATYEQEIRDYQKEFKASVDAEIRVALDRFQQLKKKHTSKPQGEGASEDLITQGLNLMLEKGDAALKLEVKRLQLLKQESEIPIQSWETEITLAMLKNDHAQAVKLANAALKEKDDRHYARFMRAWAYAQLKDDAKAQTDFSVVLDAVPTSHHSLMMKEVLAPDPKGGTSNADLQLSRMIQWLDLKVKADALEDSFTPMAGMKTDPLLLRYEYVKAYAVLHRRLEIVRRFEFSDFTPLDVLEYLYLYGQMKIWALKYLHQLDPENQQLADFYAWKTTFKSNDDDTTQKDLDEQRKLAKSFLERQPDNGYWYMMSVGLILPELIKSDDDYLIALGPVFNEEELKLLEDATMRRFETPVTPYLIIAEAVFDEAWDQKLMFSRLNTVISFKYQLLHRSEATLRHFSDQGDKVGFLKHYELLKKLFDQSEESISFRNLNDRGNAIRFLIFTVLKTDLVKRDRELRHYLYHEYHSKVDINYHKQLYLLDFLPKLPVNRYAKILNEVNIENAPMTFRVLKAPSEGARKLLLNKLEYSGLDVVSKNDHFVADVIVKLLELAVRGTREDLTLMMKFKDSSSPILRDAVDYSTTKLKSRLGIEESPTNTQPSK